MPVRVNLQLECPLVGEGAITSSTPTIVNSAVERGGG